MSVKKSSKQKNTRHHLNTAPTIAKKHSKKAQLKNNDLRTQLDKTTGLVGAAHLFASQPKKPTAQKGQEKTKVETERVVEEDMLALISMKLSSTNAH
jgi:hypothetical protein